ncbi:hypothetical protein A2313_03515 [Candidatus Roizmanbacteria bacterium RIFOXYB2_FULL_41_10]|uniref:DUF5660 domain-containing protein n=1 Tax=Candidatus Roizmanbacteria bacterium RIFOXYA1_FULL_41_12 TaxID=1802082 RepID=A0A1F7KEP5_9BACT|nr:MAG: hypothetical protein A2209_02155 [Candidatus Roizmanbacteria bacterium RIFOXYA1_FULL_41_12]OGK67134.1 MAG: hypothetical protein A2377_00545 [Candidatus Roizmanbacteria bacterium RIFOXYB1_FULL_41_27]OGK69005.1 MAG: hypothetical protein A2313_03515 [Candidatus Roizmanbacteria bacterium RIFOXYB2_FULL_41_10]OGK71539.1 MAG: hypothetical protein A2403_00880 [Candidatus Roizmanbacteria bacterium RIFOXYC1_FULL_41_16]OGK75788.1 MAG: hypothetical protein A2575_04500 [Candidatus Roizmanbacteria ba
MKTSQKAGKSSILKEVKDSFESIGSDIMQDTRDSAKSMFGDLNSQLFGGHDNAFNHESFQSGFTQEKKEPKRIRRTEIVFNYLEKQEQSRLNSEISNLMKEVKKEIEMLKLQDKALINDVSKLVVTDLPKDAGIYHLRFLEFIVKLLRSLRQKISEGRLWLQTTFDKKKQKKFRQMAKSKGTKFSLSKELTQANIPG